MPCPIRECLECLARECLQVSAGVNGLITIQARNCVANGAKNEIESRLFE